MKKAMKKALIGTGLGLAAVLGVGAMIAMGPGAPTAAPAAGLVAAVTANAAASYDVDSVHSFVVFKVKHLGASTTWGRFNTPTGTFTWDGEKSSIDVSVKAEDVDTANKKRDDHLRSGDFFGAKEFPTISFKSKSVKKTAEGKFDITGDLTLHGQTKSITAQATEGGTGKNMEGKDVLGVDFQFTIKRTDYGIKIYPGAIGDDVTLFVALEGMKK